ncbi:NADH-quinone oxidoreductase subunit M [Actinocrinis puniceicyclus]|uniref:NADH-quinone oxidoreductase subunit M n=1 Tax=Actinocrinis puniceicyclus TaxID=977794 RepID=A0A8J8BBM0_9ACTN|nr:NADH-quinone oxidoreductase subunit M [Actinocrinis puniceicyclus]MBS2962211.1 NADH-quinone oxidoreductase subunit M [Actinocrinis puniceicyclus]
MSAFPYLSTTIGTPLLGVAAIAVLPKERAALARPIALLASLVALGFAIADAVAFKTGGPRFQLSESYAWIPTFHVNYSVAVDGVALVLILMTAVLVPVVILASWHDADARGGALTPQGSPAESKRSVRGLFAQLLALETLMLGVFAATDIFLFYVIFEATLIPAYFLIGSYGGARRSYAAVKFLLYNLLGGLLMLAAVIGLYVASTHSPVGAAFSFQTLSKAVGDGSLTMAGSTEKWLFLGFFIAFAVKAPMWPFHTWLPDAASEATPGTAVLLVGVLDKIGTFGMLRFCLELFPHASHYFTPLVLVLAVISTIYGALLAIGQTDMMRLIAYTSVSHFGLITIGVFALTARGEVGATLYMVNHGLSTGALFLLAGFMISRRGSKSIDAFGGVQKVAPLLAGTFLAVGLSSLALPGLSSFVSEFLVLVGAFEKYPVAAIFGTTAIVLAALYILWWYQRTMTGPVASSVEGFKDLNRRELAVIGPLVALIVVLGFVPSILTNFINPAVSQIPAHVQITQQAPHSVAQDSATQGNGSGQ